MGMEFETKKYPLFWGTEQQLESYEELIQTCITSIKESTNVRLIVLEVWGLIDYIVRDLLISGYGLNQFCQDDFDLRYEMLPRSHHELLKLLQTTINKQNKIHQARKEYLSDMGHPYYKLSGNHEFFQYLEESHSCVVEELERLSIELHNKKHPCKKIRNNKDYIYTEKKEDIDLGIIPVGWLDEVRRLDSSWFNTAEKLNTARNKAAHFANPRIIADEFGVHGITYMYKVKNICIDMLNKLIWTDNITNFSENNSDYSY